MQTYLRGVVNCEATSTRTVPRLFFRGGGGVRGGISSFVFLMLLRFFFTFLHFLQEERNLC